MASSNRSSASQSRDVTPNPSTPRFTSQASTAEDLLQAQTVGLVQLSDFRKRRAEALEQKERETQDQTLGRFTPASSSGTATPNSENLSQTRPVKKKRKALAKGKLSFEVGEDGEPVPPRSMSATPRSETADTGADLEVANGDGPRERLGPNSSVPVAPKVMTKSALLKEKLAREHLRREFITMQEAVKATEFLIPFVFFDGTNTPGGTCRIKKGDHVWLFLDRSRKVGAELGVGASGEKSNTRREWARVGVDDLMLVRGEIIVPHHYEFYYFIVNKTIGPAGVPLFPYSAQPPKSIDTSKTASSLEDLSRYDPLSRPDAQLPASDTTQLEGGDEDPTLTKVVDRRWYERNKHIFPASVWEEFDPTKDYSKATRRDAQGNAFFFS